MNMVYRWKSISNVNGLDAQVVGEELERIRVFRNGRLDKGDVVEAARPEPHPLHRAFEWDDGKAAEAYRLEQAAHLIRHVDVVIERGEESVPVRAFVSVKRDEDRSFTSIFHALSDEELRQQVVRQAWADLEAWHSRYAELAEFAKVFAGIDEARGAK